MTAPNIPSRRNPCRNSSTSVTWAIIVGNTV